MMRILLATTAVLVASFAFPQSTTTGTKKPKLYISVDMEGVVGTVTSPAASPLITRTDWIRRVYGIRYSIAVWLTWLTAATKLMDRKRACVFFAARRERR
jgi:hypothetical protein